MILISNSLFWQAVQGLNLLKQTECFLTRQKNLTLLQKLCQFHTHMLLLIEFWRPHTYMYKVLTKSVRCPLLVAQIGKEKAKGLSNAVLLTSKEPVFWNIITIGTPNTTRGWAYYIGPLNLRPLRPYIILLGLGSFQRHTYYVLFGMC